MRFMYHATAKASLETILSEGLQPQIGPRSAALGEAMPGVYLFTSWEACEDGLMNWLGDAIDDADELVVLEVDTSGLELLQLAGYEAISLSPLDPARILRILDEAGDPMLRHANRPTIG